MSTEQVIKSQSTNVSNPGYSVLSISSLIFGVITAIGISFIISSSTHVDEGTVFFIIMWLYGIGMFYISFLALLALGSDVLIHIRPVIALILMIVCYFAPVVLVEGIFVYIQLNI